MYQTYKTNKFEKITKKKYNRKINILFLLNIHEKCFYNFMYIKIIFNFSESNC